jgi:hypothetical protein
MGAGRAGLGSLERDRVDMKWCFIGDEEKGGGETYLFLQYRSALR